MQLHSKRHHWHVCNLKIKIKQADMCRTDGSSFSTTGQGFCRDSPSADGRVRLIQHEWMWSSSCEFGETNGCDPLRLGEGGEIGWEQSGEGRNFANHGQNSHPLLLETTKSPWRKVIRQLHSSNSVASKQVVFQPAVGEPCLTYLHHMKIRPNMLTVLFCKRRVAQVC
jgi:hypothetical protein